MTKATDPDVLGLEAKFAVYCPPPYGSRTDIHLVKETIHMKDGTTKPNVRIWRDYKFPFYTTKKGYRNHKDNKEWELLDRVDKYMTTQSEKNFAMAKALGMMHFKDPRALKRSPYLYGADLLSTSHVKKAYMDKFPTCQSKYTVAAFDVETDEVHGTKAIIMASLTFGDRVFTAVHKSYFGTMVDVEDRARRVFDLHIGDVYKDRKIKWELEIVDREVDIILKCFEKAHEWKPDFVAIWNINFDMPMMLACLQRAGYRPEDVFCDPAVPVQYRHFKYKVGQNRKVTASGKISPIPPSDQWHTVFCPSSFYFIDAMCVYRNLRSQKGRDPSYGLDAILLKTFKSKIRKLKFKEADHLRGIDWHIFMQKNYKLEYLIYNVFDCVAMELLDEETKDLQLTMPSFAAWTDFCNFNSQPRRLVDTLHFYCLETEVPPRVIGSTSDEMKNELDELTVGLAGWIVTLPAHLVADNGLYALAEDAMLRTNIRGHVGDLDVSASYPNGECVFNISKETTTKEMVKIAGIPERIQRAQGINLSGGATNAVEFGCEMFGLPRLDDWLEAFGEDHDMEFNIPKYAAPIRTPLDDVRFGDAFEEEDDEDEEEDEEAEMDAD
ncbi:3'-5' exonuclease [Paraburkholderia sp. BCC1886]|uniref:3'-5' exonuclease n=1 Tax=Paraburkholderia sp. BCC1886 TaxID=2562670 RepID=UPI0011835C45|nr:3'-5' exonuclease [Paraburkholderia sp. BCC1886]